MQTVTADKVKELKKDTTLINVLPEDSFSEEHIPGSVNIPLKSEDFLKQVELLVQEKDRPVILYCSGPDCDASPTAAKKLEEAGFKNVLEFEGGLKEWKEKGLQIESGPGAKKEGGS